MLKSSARDFWEAVVSGKISSQNLVTNRVRESVILEYKEVPSDYKEGKFRAVVSKVLSGFANSAGGVVVWGIATGKGPEKDVATSIRGLSDPTDFIGWLNDTIPNAVQPTCVTHTAIMPGETPITVATYIPSSDLPPHQATLETNKPYYTRLDGQFRVMENHMLEDMFRRRLHPNLVLNTTHLMSQPTSLNPSPSTKMVTISTFVFSLNNEGRGSARYPDVILRIADNGGSRTAWRHLDQFTKEYSDQTIEFSLGIERIIYPVSTFRIGQLEVTWYTSDHPILIEAKIQAEDMAARTVSYALYSDGQIK